MGLNIAPYVLGVQCYLKEMHGVMEKLHYNSFMVFAQF